MTFTFDDWQGGLEPPDGWDCADAIRDGWTAANLIEFMRRTVRQWSPPVPVQQPEPAQTPPPAAARPAGSVPVREARTVSQEKPAEATVTSIRTRAIYVPDDAWKMELVTNEDGAVKPNVTKNWALFMENHPEMSGVFAYDAFKLRVMVMRRPPWDAAKVVWEPRVLQDRDYSEAVMWLEGLHMTPKVSNIAATVQTVAEHHSFDRLNDYLDSLKWDGRKRVETWLTYYLGAADSEYMRTIAACWLVSSVARGLKPGCKVDTMPILEGPQGARKSTALRLLYGDEFFTDELSDIGSKDAMMELQGVWGLEVAEMHRFSAAETNAVKKFLSRQTDRFRPPYGRSVIEAPRRVVLCGTINPEGNPYLRDPTGARRFWPVTIGSIDLHGLREDRDMLWAEAVHMYRANAPWWVQDEQQAGVEAEQEKRTEVDAWVDLIVPMVHGKRTISQVEILQELGIPKKDADRRYSDRIARIMKKIGWQAYRDRRGGEDRMMFKAPGAQEDLSGGW